HLIPIPVASLFGKISRDLKPGGLLVFTAPGLCCSNLALSTMRRLVRLFRGSWTDSLLFWVGKRFYPDVPEETLRQRLVYMYVLPEFLVTRRFCRRLAAFGLQLLFMGPEQVSPLGTLKHQITVFRKR